MYVASNAATGYCQKGPLGRQSGGVDIRREMQRMLKRRVRQSEMARRWRRTRAASRAASLLVLLAAATALEGCRLFREAPRTESTVGGSALLASRALLGRYARAGMLAAPEPVTFVGTLRTLGGPRADSGLVLIALSLPTRSLTFVREGSLYRAVYDVAVEFRQADSLRTRVATRQVVRVSTYTETVREEESVIFQEMAYVVAGTYDVSVTVRDSATGARGVSTMPFFAPRLVSGELAAPVVVHQAEGRVHRDSAPELLVNPRATLAADRDTLLRVYLEGYGLQLPQPVGYVVQDERGRALQRDTTSLTGGDSALIGWEHGVVSGVFTVRTRRLSPGQYWLGTWRQGASDSSWTPFFILQGERLARHDARTGTHDPADGVAVANERFPARRAGVIRGASAPDFLTKE